MNTIFIFGFFPFYCLDMHYGLIYFELNRVIRLKTESGEVYSIQQYVINYEKNI